AHIGHLAVFAGGLFSLPCLESDRLPVGALLARVLEVLLLRRESLNYLLWRNSFGRIGDKRPFLRAQAGHTPGEDHNDKDGGFHRGVGTHSDYWKSRKQKRPSRRSAP